MNFGGTSIGICMCMPGRERERQQHSSNYVTVRMNDDNFSSCLALMVTIVLVLAEGGQCRGRVRNVAGCGGGERETGIIIL